jgi:hypothetical protein
LPGEKILQDIGGERRNKQSTESAKVKIISDFFVIRSWKTVVQDFQDIKGK